MREKIFLSSLTRISDLETRPFEIVALPRDAWATGDYAIVRVERPPTGFRQVELSNGRVAEAVAGDMIVGALGERYATLEAVGSWRAVGENQRMHALTAAGLLGKATSVSIALAPLLAVTYTGHVIREGHKVTMSDFVPTIETVDYRCPTILFIGTSMSAGKTACAKVAIRQLKKLGLRVVGCKLTGAGRYRDVLGMQDAGADAIFDFVDVGLPSTIAAKPDFEASLRVLLNLIANARPDVVVAEAGASPMEPYNGDVVTHAISEQVCSTVLCASDPYAVAGVMHGFGTTPELVAGLATNTIAGRELVQKLTGVEAINMLDPASQPRLEELFAPFSKYANRSGG